MIAIVEMSNLHNEIRTGIMMGTISGILFGLLMSIFVFIQKKKFRSIGLEITKGQEILYDGGANHFKGSVGVGGWLILTREAVIVKSHNFNFQNHILKIPLTEIREVKGINKITFARL